MDIGTVQREERKRWTQVLGKADCLALLLRPWRLVEWALLSSEHHLRKVKESSNRQVKVASEYKVTLCDSNTHRPRFFTYRHFKLHSRNELPAHGSVSHQKAWLFVAEIISSKSHNFEFKFCYIFPLHVYRAIEL
jgi:hypothetical protein